MCITWVSVAAASSAVTAWPCLPGMMAPLTSSCLSPPISSTWTCLPGWCDPKDPWREERKGVGQLPAAGGMWSRPREEPVSTPSGRILDGQLWGRWCSPAFLHGCRSSGHGFLGCLSAPSLHALPAPARVSLRDRWAEKVETPT